MMGWITTLRVLMGRDGGRIVRLDRDLEGLLALDECAWLYRSALGRREIVEIGSYRGKSAVLLALGSAACRGVVTAIDPHFTGEDVPRMQFDGEDRRVLQEQLRRHGVASRVHEVVLTSREALREWDGRPIDLLWVDGDHSEEAVAFDLGEWGRFVGPGGLVAAHDYPRSARRSGRFPGVKLAWDRLMTRENGWGPTRRVRRIVWAQRLGATDTAK